MVSVLCNLDDSTLGGGSSPFARLLAFGYEDGPTEGVVQCAGCSMAYWFELLAIDVDGVHDRIAWERGAELRVFALSPLPAGTFKRIVDVLSAVEEPRWPAWMPTFGRTSPLVNSVVERWITPAITSAGLDRIAVVAPDLLSPIVAARPLVGEAVDGDWFALLGTPVAKPAGQWQ